MRNPDYPLRNKWYNSYKFPIVPQLRTKPGDFHNTPGFTFEWLILKIWSLDSPGFEIALNCDTHFGIGVTAILPYLRVVLCVPLPQKFSEWSMNNLWRKPPVCKQS